MNVILQGGTGPADTIDTDGIQSLKDGVLSYKKKIQTVDPKTKKIKVVLGSVATMELDKTSMAFCKANKIGGKG